MKHRLIEIAFGTELVSTRFLLALGETLWVLNLLVPGDSFTRPTYSVMGAVAPEWVWTWVFFFTAICQWYILFSGKFHTRGAVIFAGWSSILWSFVVLSMYSSVSPPPVAISWGTALVCAAGWIFLRSGYHVIIKERGLR